MIELNKKLLSEIPEKYEIKTVDILADKFSSYELCKNRDLFKETVYLLLSNDYSMPQEVETILEEITIWEKSKALKHGNSYLCVMPVIHGNKDMCTFFNGNSFCHFILFDIDKKCLFYNKDFYYSSGKRIKELIDICQRIFL